MESQWSKKRQSEDTKWCGLNWKYWILMLILILIPIVGFGCYIAYVACNFKQPTAKISDYKFSEMDLQKLDLQKPIKVALSISAKLDNPNSVGANLDHLKIDIYHAVLNYKIGQGEASNVSIIANGQSIIPIKVNVEIPIARSMELLNECVEKGSNKVKFVNHIKFKLFKIIPWSHEFSMEQEITELCQMIAYPPLIK